MKNTGGYLGLMLLFFSLTFSQELKAKKACKKYLDKLHQVQAKQRNGNSLKQSNKLKEQEYKARETWWACENGKLPKKKTGKKRKRQKPEKIVRLTPQKSETKAKKPAKTAVPFATKRAIVLKAEYQGQQQLDWLAFYKQPAKCRQPKDIKVFAACVEDKRLQQQIFEQNYRK